MGRIFIVVLLSIIRISAIVADAQSKPILHPIPESEKMNEMYIVHVDGEKIDCQRAHSSNFLGGEYYFVSFDFEKNAEIRLNIVTWKSLKDVKVYPQGIKFKRNGESTITIKAKKPPFTAIVAQDGRNLPLVIFGNSFETDIPDKNDKNVFYFEKGVHVIPQIKLTSGQTLYLEAGAILKSSIRAEGKDITICGRGTISGELKSRFSKYYFMRFYKCENLKIRDITIKEAPNWSIFLDRCNGVSINGIKICNSRCINDDAIDVCNSSNVNIKNVFARAQDDIVAIKGIKRGSPDTPPCENISVRDCIFWTDRANIFRIGYDSYAKFMSNIRVKNIEVPFYSTDCVGFESSCEKAIIAIQAGNEMSISNLRFENINIHSNGDDQNVFLAHAMTSLYGKSTVAGRISDCIVKNLKVLGTQGDFKGGILIKGANVGDEVSGIKFSNIDYFSQPVAESCKNVTIEKARDITFVSTAKNGK